MSTIRTIDGPDLTRLFGALKDADAQASTRLRRNIREAAKAAATDVKSTVLLPPPNDAPGTVGTRAAIASGIGVRFNTGKKGASVTITGSSKNLPPARKSMLRLYNKAGGWRHPVYSRKHSGTLSRKAGGLRGKLGARQEAWVHQQGRPYFGAVIVKHREQVQAAVIAAIDEANAILLRSAK